MRSFTFLVLTTSAVSVAVGQQPDRPRCRDCSTAEGRASVEARAAQVRDSVRVRSIGIGVDIERLAVQLLTTRRLQVEAEQALQALLSGQAVAASRAQAEMTAQRLRQRIDQAGRESQLLRAQLASMCDRNAKPQGYMGITFSATMRADAAGSGDEVFRFAENPTVETVEPGSPAERAGVTKGDEIILIGGQEVVGRDIVFTRLLRPGNQLAIRVRRDGDTRDVHLLVGQRPPTLDNGCPFLDARIMAAFGDAIAVSPLAPLGGVVRAGPIPSAAVMRRVPGAATPVADAPIAPTPRVSGTVTVVPAAPVPPGGVPEPASRGGVAGPRRGPERVFVFSGTSTAPMVIAGATIIPTNPDLRETFGVKNGVLVLDVARGSPAYASGLKGGDVIVRAGRAPVTSPLSIQRAIERTDASQLTLSVIRKKKEQAIVLRW